MRATALVEPPARLVRCRPRRGTEFSHYYTDNNALDVTVTVNAAGAAEAAD